jgi:hypothetical protein
MALNIYHNQITDDVMGGTCNANGGRNKYVQHFCWKDCKSEDVGVDRKIIL